MKVWILTMVDDEGGILVKVFSTVAKAEGYINDQLAEDSEGEILKWQRTPGCDVPFYYSEALEVTFHLVECEVDA